MNRREEDRDRPVATATEEAPLPAAEKKDPFEEIDFGSFFQEYLDPGYRTPGEMEEVERPSFENFLSKPSNSDRSPDWQLGALPVSAGVREAAELIIGNLSEDGYLIASDDELLGVAPPAPPEVDATIVANVVKQAEELGLGEIADLNPSVADVTSAPASPDDWMNAAMNSAVETETLTAVAPMPEPLPAPAPVPSAEAPAAPARPVFKANFSLADLQEALEVVRQMDPPGVGCRDLRECLMYQLRLPSPSNSKNRGM